MTNLVAKILGGSDAESGNDHPLFTSSPVPSLLYGCDGVVTAANPAALTLFRCGNAQLRGVSLASLIPELDHGFDVASLTSHRRLAVRRPDGNNFIARVQLARLRPAIAGPLLATIEDLSEYEQEMAASHKEMESFMSAAGHDLRGPLRILKGFTDALEDECGETLSEEGRTFLKEILKAADRMEGLIDGLLALSRAGRAEMTFETLDLTTLVDLVLYELRHEKNARSVEVSVEPGMVAWGDVRLTMVLLRNLIGNAWKFTARVEHPQIRIHSEVREGRTYYCVTDNGAGFDMAHADRLFQPFTRLHRQDEFPGQGLGLATVRRIVRRHGGDVHAEAFPEQGTTIRFWLRPAPRD
jgi:light-regulated signal transduction histidine kinase (bacteriophytochrome)